MKYIEEIDRIKSSSQDPNNQDPNNQNPNNQELTKPRISVIVPVYNVEGQVESCILSLINQTYPNLEIILIDDGSTDSSGSICDQYIHTHPDHNIRVFHQVNKGLSVTRNLGLEVATGDYIGFVDSDDQVHPRMYEYMEELIRNQVTDLAIVEFMRFHHVEEIQTMESWRKDARHTAANWRKDAWRTAARLTRTDLLRNLHGLEAMAYTVVWNKLYKKETLADIRFQPGRYNEDEMFIYEVYQKIDSAAYSNEALYYYYYNPDSITTNPRYLLNEDIFEAYEIRLKDQHIQQHLNWIYKAYMNRIIKRYEQLTEAIYETKQPRRYLLRNEQKDQFKQHRKNLVHRYRKLYRTARNYENNLGYRIFWAMPRTYQPIFRMKEKLKEMVQ